MLFSYHLITYFTSEKCKVGEDESCGVINLINQLSHEDGQKMKLLCLANMLKSTPQV